MNEIKQAILDVSTILGGISASWFLWEKAVGYVRSHGFSMPSPTGFRALETRNKPELKRSGSDIPIRGLPLLSGGMGFVSGAIGWFVGGEYPGLSLGALLIIFLVVGIVQWICGQTENMILEAFLIGIGPLVTMSFAVMFPVFVVGGFGGWGGVSMGAIAGSAQAFMFAKVEF